MARPWWLHRWLGRSAVSALRSSPSTFGLWLKNVGALSEALGAEAAEGYTRLVVQALADGDVAEELAATLPDVLAGVAPDERRRLLRVLSVVLRDSPQTARSVAVALPQLLSQMDDEALVQFLARGLERHGADAQRLDGYLHLHSEASLSAVEELTDGVSLLSLYRPLSLYVRAHCGEAVQIRPGDGRAFTDGRHLYLPERLHHFGDARDEDALWIHAALAAGHLEFGSMNIALENIDGAWPEPRPEELPYERMIRAFDNTAIARALFGILEGARVRCAVRKTYPGMARRMDGLGPLPGPDFGRTEVDIVLAGLASSLLATEPGGASRPALVDELLTEVHPDTWGSVRQSIEALQKLYPRLRAMLKDADEFERSPSMGLDPARMSAEDRAIEKRASELLTGLEQVADWEEARATARTEDGDGLGYTEVSEFLDRNQAPAGPLRTDDADESTVNIMHRDVDRARGERRWRYPEWDADLGDYKPDWVGVIEYHLAAGESDFVDSALAEYGGTIARLRRTFEAMRPDSLRPRRGLQDGDTLDMDAVLSARVARRAGVAGPTGLYRARRPAERSVSVAFLVDMSSSTNEHINTAGKRIIDVEREALVVAAEAVDALGDSMAIYGYSGFGREAVAFYVAKDFSEPYGPTVRERIGRMGWKLENRDGAAIRHAVHRLSSSPTKTKLLILLSDGKPLDGGCSSYNNHYAQMDTRMALLEARKVGVHPFCITVDPHARDYLRRMYGSGGYTIIDSADELPARLPALYRQLTA